MTVFPIFLGCIAFCLVSCVSPAPTASPTPAIGKLSDGSTVTIAAVSYGIVHLIPPYAGTPPYSAEYISAESVFKSVHPTIMFTTLRQVHGAPELDNPWTQAEAQDSSGNWYPLQPRTRPNPNEPQFKFFDGAPPVEMWETWEFPHCPKPGPWLRVRIELTRDETNVSSVEFKIPNDEKWRERYVNWETTWYSERSTQ